MDKTEAHVQAQQAKQALVEQVLAEIPSDKRRVLEQCFGYYSEASIDETVDRLFADSDFTDRAQWVAAMEAVGQDPRSLALAQLMRH